MADDRPGGKGGGEAADVSPEAPGAVANDAGQHPAASASDAAHAASAKAPWLPPRLFVRLFWYWHRAYCRITGGRRGLWLPRAGKWGAMRLHSVGRRSGKERVAILGYYEDGPNLVTLAMNGWAADEPAWWLNLRAHPDARVELKDGWRAVRARAAEGEERGRLWSRWYEFGDDVDGFSTLRPTETAVVVLEPGPIR